MYFWKYQRLALLLLASEILYSCNSGKEERIVFNKSSHRLQEIDRIQLEEGDKNAIGRISEMHIDQSGTIYLVDFVSTKIKTFSSKGKFIREIGGFGEEPGKFRKIFSMDVKNRLIVSYDMDMHRITLFDTTGIYIRSFNTQSDDAYHFGSTISFTKRGTILHGEEAKNSSKKKDHLSFRWLVCEYDTLGNRLSQFGQYDRNVIKDSIEGYDYGFPFVRVLHSIDKVYLCLSGLPFILEYDRRFSLNQVLKITTPMTSLRPMNNSKINIEEAIEEAKKYYDRPFSEIALFDVLEESQIMLVLQLRYIEQKNLKGGPPVQKRSFYLSAFDLTNGNIPVIVDLIIPPDNANQPFLPLMAVGPSDIIYMIINDNPDQFILGKYCVVKNNMTKS